MKREDVNEVLVCLGGERRVFHYFKDRYCLDLIDLEMKNLAAHSLKISELKSGPLRRLTQKPIVVQALKHCGSGNLSRHDLQRVWPLEQLPLVLALTGWGGRNRSWDQTTRNQCNLVLQLNFDSWHIGQYNRLIKPDDDCGPFEYREHPVVEGKRKTLSWVRMDIAFDTGEALVEEIQNDWLRYACRALTRVRRRRLTSPLINPSDVIADIHGRYEDLEYYVECILKPYREWWAEASMLAAVKFIREDLGISRIYYHSFDTGKKIKKVSGFPPRSIYTRLPVQFGFGLTDQAPQFLKQDKFARRCIKAIKNPRWYKLMV